MSVIAWDGETLAADKLVTFGATKGAVTKIFRIGDRLVGAAGNLSVAMETIQWFGEGAIPDKYPPANRGSDGASLLVVLPEGDVWKYESSPYPFKLEGPFCAIGCGDESALIAMACGKTAAEAVALVSEYNAACGNGIDTLTMPSIDQTP